MRIRGCARWKIAVACGAAGAAWSVGTHAQTANPLAATDARPQYVSVSTSVSPATIKPGGRAVLVVDVTPQPRIHVYAPGAKGYLPIALKAAVVGPTSGIRIQDTVYPKSELLVFAPLNERVPVFQTPFRLTRALVLPPAVRAGTTVKVSGAVDYQACNDTVCFAPASLPVSWSVAVK